MQSLSIIEHFNILKDRLSGLLSGRKGLPTDTLGFERAEEALHERVIVTITFLALRPEHGMNARTSVDLPVLVVDAHDALPQPRVLLAALARGTRLSSPLWSAVIVIAMWDSVHASRFGNANLGPYTLLSTSNACSSYFHDITGKN